MTLSGHPTSATIPPPRNATGGSASSTGTRSPAAGTAAPASPAPTTAAWRGSTASWCRRAARCWRSAAARATCWPPCSPRVGVGVDFSGEMVRRAAERHPQPALPPGRRPRALGSARRRDVRRHHPLRPDQRPLGRPAAARPGRARLAHRRTRVILNFYSRLWELPLALAARWGWPGRRCYQNWLTVDDVENLLRLAGFETIRHWQEVLLPLPIPLLGAAVPTASWCASGRSSTSRSTNFVVARPRAPAAAPSEPVVSVIVPARNEAGNIAQHLRPHAGDGRRHRADLRRGALQGRHLGGHRARDRRPSRAAGASSSSRPARARGTPCAWASREATGDVLMILDADLTVPPEDLPRFYEVLRSGQGRVRQRRAPRLPDGEGGDALRQPARQQVLQPGLLLAARPADQGHAVRHQGAAQAGLRDASPPTAPTSATSTRSATSTCSSARPS